MYPFRLVFDLDDTLYSERQFAISGFRACERWIAREHGVSRSIVEEMVELLDQGHMRPLFGRVLETCIPGHSESLLETFIDVYRRHEPEIELYRDAAAALDHFEDLGPLGLITDGGHEVQAAKVRALDLERRFERIIYTSALGGRAFSKPNPRAFELMAETLGAPGHRLVYVGDNPAKDFVAPNAMGWLTVQVLRPQRIHARAQQAPGGAPRHVIETLEDLPALLLSESAGGQA